MRRDSERDCRQFEKVHARRSAGLELDREEREREKYVLEAVRDWHTAQQIRAYLAAFRESVDSGHRRISDRAVYENYLRWVSYFAVKFDPLITTGPRPGEPTPTNTALSELDISNRLRTVLEALGVQTTNDVAQLRDEDVQPYAGGWSHLRKEIARVLFGLGYAVPDES